jgi:hypothetical protein
MNWAVCMRSWEKRKGKGKRERKKERRKNI